MTGTTDVRPADVGADSGPPHNGRTPRGRTARSRTARARRLRLIAVFLGLGVVTAVGYIMLLATGPVQLTPSQVLDALTGGDTDRTISIVWDLRLPVAIATVAVGAALGLAGAWTQTMSRNPIASPDVLGITGGASVAVVAGTVVARPAFSEDISTFWWRAAMALVGAAVIVGLLLLFGGFGSSRRVVVIGFALSLLCSSLVSYLLLRADLTRATEAQTWLAGSTGLVRAGALVPLSVGLLVFTALGAAVSRDLPLLAHDDATAAALGVRVPRVRMVLLVASTGLAAVTVAVVGPIGFVALVAPQLVRLLTGRPTPPPATSAVGGAAVITVCALAAEALPFTAPVGLITAVVGGPVLIALVLGSARRGGRSTP
ncbi:FecCD family ABC transporter permease [Tomitella cavernea]|uniref:FecCD family ABC transporter permease n=1 Tax=Tomitella cavernea TaxID=1387982 RepID=UPI00190647A8|nr:iron ABC transporter permease [Tomitella cavernea]